MSQNKGIALILVILIIVIIAVAALGIATFVTNSMYLVSQKASLTQAVFAAQAGVYAALYDYLADPTQPFWTKTANQNLADNIYYHVGQDLNFLLIDAYNPQRDQAGTVYTLRRIPLSNINNSQSITINAMRVERYVNYSPTHRSYLTFLTGVALGDTSHWTWEGSVSIEPATAPIITFPDVTIPARESFSLTGHNRWRFSGSSTAGWYDDIIVVTFFYMTGPTIVSSRRAILKNGGDLGRKEFSITATGEVRGARNIKRTIEATFSTRTREITSWQEIDRHVQ